MGLALSDRRDVVAAEPLEAAALLHRPPRAAVRRHRTGLLDEAAGPARRDPAASRFRQPNRPAAFLSVRAGRLRGGSPNRAVLDARRLRAAFCADRRVADPQSVARPLQRARRMAVDLFLSLAAPAGLRPAPIRPRPRRRRDPRRPPPR